MAEYECTGCGWTFTEQGTRDEYITAVCKGECEDEFINSTQRFEKVSDV